MALTFWLYGLVALANQERHVFIVIVTSAAELLSAEAPLLIVSPARPLTQAEAYRTINLDPLLRKYLVLYLLMEEVWLVWVSIFSAHGHF